MTIKWLVCAAVAAGALALILARPAPHRSPPGHGPELAAWAAPPAGGARSAGGVPVPRSGAPAPAAASRADVDRILASIETRVRARGALLSSDLAEADLAITRLSPVAGEEQAKQRLVEFNVRIGGLAQELASRPRADPPPVSLAPAPPARAPLQPPPPAGWVPPPPPPSHAGP